MKVKSESEVAQSCLTLSDPIDCSLPGSSVHGILQARVLEWVEFHGNEQTKLAVAGRYTEGDMNSLLWCIRKRACLDFRPTPDLL